MSLKVLPVVFAGLEYGHRADKRGPRWREQHKVEEKLRTYGEQIEGIELLELRVLEDKQEVPDFLNLAAQADTVVCAYCELLAAVWAADALASSPVPVILHGRKNAPGAVFADLYGYLRTDGCDAHMALDLPDLRAILSGLAAKKRLAETTALIIGQAFPSCSQAASPASPELLTEKLGVQVIVRSIDDLMTAFQAADTVAAEAQAKQWFEGAERIEAREAVEQDIVQIAKVHLAIEQMIDETGANAFTIDCRTWDELTMEEFGRFYGPCISLTTLRYEGIPAGCEADTCALLALCALTYVSGLPTFLGNIAHADPSDGWIGVGGHASATVNMDGSRDGLEGYWLTDYAGRGTGCASYCPVPDGLEVTFARFDKNLDNLFFATGTSRVTDRGFQVAIGDVDDFMHRCLVGDHHGVVYGNHARALRVLAQSLGMGVLEPGKPL